VLSLNIIAQKNQALFTAAKDQFQKIARYLEERKDMVNFGSLKRDGYHIGSGGIESSNKFIANARLKRSCAF
jgi:hypothetical protein